MLKVENLTKSFGDVAAVDNLSFQIGKTEVVGLLGPNGAGKTTTMRLITGFLAPDSGTVWVEGRIGYLPENNPLYKDMLTAEVLKLSADLKRVPKEKRRSAFEFVVASSGINEVFYRPVSELSKGYKQRVGIAVALLNDPEILIMDEPTEGLDPNQRGEIRGLIKNLAQERIVVISTHVLQEASALCSRLLIINKGKLIADGTAQELSQGAHKQQIVLVDIEGNNVEYLLKNIQGVQSVSVEKSDGRRVKARVISAESFEVRPAISQLVRENQWTLWQVAEQEHKLEDIFQELTTEDSVKTL